MQKPPISLSFKDFRDEEIVGFFANENRTYRPDGDAPSTEHGRNRLIGAPHFARKPSRKSVLHPGCMSSNALTEKSNPNDTSTITVEMLHGFASKDTDEAVQEKLREKRIEPSFQKITRPLGAMMSFDRQNQTSEVAKPAKVLYNPLQSSSTDRLLDQLIEIWPRLSSEQKKAISKIIAE